MAQMSALSLAALRVYWYILRASIAERLTYRGDFAFSTFVRFLPIVTQIFLWAAIFNADNPDGTEPRGAIHGYQYSSMVAYYLLANLARAFSSMPGLAAGIAREIRDGTVKRYLTQPVDMLAYMFWARLAHKLVYYFVATVPFAVVFYLCRGFFETTPDLFTIVSFVLFLLLSFLIGFMLESMIGLAAFWFLEVNSLIFIFMMLNYFLSGHMLPLDYLTAGMPGVVATIMNFLPFQYLAYFPAAVMLNRFDHAHLVLHLQVALGWVVVLAIINRLMFRLGVRRYSAYGG